MRADAGFTVLEALVAFAVLSLVLVALYEAGGTSLRSLDRDARMQTAALLAQSKLAQISVQTDLLPADSDGTFPDSDVSWKLTTTDVSDPKIPNTSLKLQQVHLTLTWQEGFQERSLSFETRHLGLVRP